MLIREYIYNSLQDIYPAEEAKSLATILCRDILHLSELDIYLGKIINLSGEKKNLLENSLHRLKEYEPIQYISGVTEFMGLPFTVAPGVLIPRPETEELVELIINSNIHGLRILDIGTGSGCIAIALSRNLPDAYVEAWDISPAAIKIAQRNNDQLKAGVVFKERDILTFSPGQEQFDIIVSNPPYITEQEKVHMERNVLDWEPGTALFVPDNDPLLFYRQIATVGKKILTPEGKIFFEINRSYGEETVSLLKELNYRRVELIRDIYGNNRMVTATR